MQEMQTVEKSKTQPKRLLFKYKDTHKVGVKAIQ